MPSPHHRHLLASLTVLVSLLLVLTLATPVADVDAAAKGRPPKPTPTPTPTPTAPAGNLEGIDVSQWQGTIGWSQVAAAGKKFAFLRASSGSLTKDTAYAANLSGATAANIPHGAYHFANPDSAANDAVNEANWFLENAYGSPLVIPHGQIIPALDVEVANGLSTTQMQAWVGTWLSTVSAALGVKPMIYSTPSFWKTSMGDTDSFAKAGYTVLWIAHWGATAPTVPASNWGGRGWTFWQYSSTGSVPGISGAVDLDRYNGTSLAPSLFVP